MGDLRPFVPSELRVLSLIEVYVLVSEYSMHFVPFSLHECSHQMNLAFLSSIGHAFVQY